MGKNRFFFNFTTGTYAQRGLRYRTNYIEK